MTDDTTKPDPWDGYDDEPDETAAPSNEVGYCKPPTSGKFQKGVSGNPLGRPRKSRAAPNLSGDDYHTMILRALSRELKINEGGQTRSIPTIEAMIMRLTQKAVTGDTRAMKLLFELGGRSSKRIGLRAEKYRKTYNDIAIRDMLEDEQAAAENRRRPQNWPDSKDYAIDATTLEIILNGPVSRTEAKEWEEANKRGLELESIVRGLKEDIEHLQERPDATSSWTQIELEWKNFIIRIHEHEMDALSLIYPAAAVRRQPGFNLERQRQEANRRIKTRARRLEKEGLILDRKRRALNASTSRAL